MTKFEQVSSDDHQMTVAGVGVRSDVWRGKGVGPRSDVGGGVPYLFHDTCDVSTPSPLNRIGPHGRFVHIFLALLWPVVGTFGG